MLWSRERQFFHWPFEKEAELEAAVLESQRDLFGDPRIYVDVKRLIGQSGKTRNVPDGYPFEPGRVSLQATNRSFYRIRIWSLPNEEYVISTLLR